MGEPLFNVAEASVPALSMLVALAVDRAFGEPSSRWHPVVAMGRYLGALGPRLWALPPSTARLAGAMAWVLGALVALALGLALEVGLHAAWALGPSGAWGAVLTAMATGLLLKPMLSWRMLCEEVAAVDAALARSLPEGRERLARLVSRPVDTLDATEVREAAIETLTENLNDSVVAPLFWFALGGLPAAVLYRFANTADAMWGYKDHRRWMGAWAARADDVLSWLPARLSALLLCAAAGRWPGWGAMRREAALTPSPNGGWPMGTTALLLGVSLNKPGAYALNAGSRAVAASDLPRALGWCGRSVWLAWGLLAVLTMWAGDWLSSCLPVWVSASATGGWAHA